MSQRTRFNVIVRRVVFAGLAPIIVATASTLEAQDSAVPEEHFSVDTPGVLSPEEASDLYGRIIDDMVDAYTLSQDPSASGYRRWRQYNAAPYQSATHGSRYVNNYANAIARDYGRLGEIDEMPVGAILAKDSFAATEVGDVFLGPLFLMEKMEKGFAPEARDWRYSMIMPDGSYYGITNSDGAERVAFCVTCHEAAGDEMDHLFFVPKAYRLSE
jgi:hypothetical protein